MGTIKTTNIEPIADNGTVTLGSSGDTFTLASGVTQTIANNTPAFYVYKNAVQAVANNTETVVTWPVERFDTDSAFASNTFTVPSGEGGKYLFNAGIRWDASADFEAIRISIRKNGASFSSCWGRNEYYNTQQITSILDLSATDTVDIVGKQSYGSSVNIGSADQGDISWFQGFKLT
jgi:hypothetical protein